MTEFKKMEAPMILPPLHNVFDLRTKKYEQGIVYMAYLEVLHRGKEAFLGRYFCVDKMLISDFSMLIESRYKSTFRAVMIYPPNIHTICASCLHVINID